jgi:hypothetical protein
MRALVSSLLRFAFATAREVNHDRYITLLTIAGRLLASVAIAM